MGGEGDVVGADGGFRGEGVAEGVLVADGGGEVEEGDGEEVADEAEDVDEGEGWGCAFGGAAANVEEGLGVEG